LNTHTGGVAKGYLYTNNGFWDTFRTVYPLLSLLDRDLYAEIAEGFYNYYVDTGWLPKWVCPYNFNCMPGMLIEATMSDAIVKEIIKGELAENVFRAMLKDGECDSGIKGVGRTQLSLYRKLGYLPYDVMESVNETLDNSFGDFAIAKAAEKLCHADIAKRYFEYSKNYRNLFDKDAGFIRGKDENGNFREENFDPFLWCNDYTEGSAWQNAFGVYHDIKGLDELYEGKLSEKIDELMNAPAIFRTKHHAGMIHEMSELAAGGYGQCAISNQPSFHIPYIYGALGESAKTAYHVERLARLFDSSPEGYPGDEDNGSMSAWYILSCMGLYQMAPSDPSYVTSRPLLDKITVTLSSGKLLSINKEEFDVENMKFTVPYDEIMDGGNLWDKLKK
jgi:predicted alpha-1,2-mannosidase